MHLLVERILLLSKMHGTTMKIIGFVTYKGQEHLIRKTEKNR